MLGFGDLKKLFMTWDALRRRQCGSLAVLDAQCDPPRWLTVGKRWALAVRGGFRGISHLADTKRTNFPTRGDE